MTDKEKYLKERLEELKENDKRIQKLTENQKKEVDQLFIKGLIKKEVLESRKDWTPDTKNYILYLHHEGPY
jgi:hypothetical protein